MNRIGHIDKIEAGPNAKSNPDGAVITADTKSRPTSRIARAKAAAALLSAVMTVNYPETPDGHLKPSETPGVLTVDLGTGDVHATGQLYGAHGQPVEGPWGVQHVDRQDTPLPSGRPEQK